MEEQKIEIEWAECKPYTYGTYKGILKNGGCCTIEVDWKIKVYNVYGKKVGTDEIHYWYCSAKDIKNFIFELERMVEEMQA